MDVGVVLVPVVWLGGTGRKPGANLHDDVRDVPCRGIRVVPLLGDRAWVGLGVVDEHDEATVDLQPRGITGVVRCEVLKIRRYLARGWRRRQALLLVVNAPADVAHLGHAQQKRQAVIGLARVLPVRSPPRRDAQRDARVLHRIEVRCEDGWITRVVVAERGRINGERIGGSGERFREPGVVEGRADRVLSRGVGDWRSEEVGHRSRGGVARGRRHAADAEAVFDRAQQRIVVVRRRGRHAGLTSRADEDRRDLVHRREVVLVPRDHQQRVRARERGAAEDLRHLALQPRIAGRDRAVVHVVAEVRSDERKVRRRASAQVSRELRVRHDVASASRDVGLDVGEVDKRVVLRCVGAAGRKAGASGRRHRH